MGFAYDHDCPFEAFITNLGKYNEGELVGEWVKFPTDAETLAGVLDRIGIGSCNELGCPYEEWFITDYDCYVPGIYDLLGEYENLDELNMLASKLEDLTDYELDKYQAVIESGEMDSSVRDLINLADNLDCYENYPDIDNDRDFGYFFIHETGIYDLDNMGNLAAYIDYERFGRDCRILDGGVYTSFGYVVQNGGRVVEFYDGHEMPEEYRVTSVAENYLKNAEMSMEDDYNQIDGMINNGPKNPELQRPFRDQLADAKVSLATEPKTEYEAKAIPNKEEMEL